MLEVVSAVRRRSNRALGIGAAALIGVVALVTWQTISSTETLHRADRAYELLRQFDEVRHSLILGRGEHRAYLVDQDLRFLEGYRAAQRELALDLERLRVLTQDEPEQQVRVRSLRERVDAVSSVRERALQLRTRSVEAAAQYLASPEARAAVQAEEELSSSIAALEASLFRSRIAAQRRAHNMLLASICALLGLASGFGLLAVRHLRRHALQVSNSERNYRTLADDCPDGVYVVCEEHLVYANAVARELWGATSPQELLGRPIFSLLHPDDRALVAQRIREVVTKGARTSPRVVRLLREDGSCREVEARGTAIDFGGRAAVQVVARDISERRAAELALLLSEQRFRAVLDSMTEGVVLQDRSGAIELSNPAAERILGLRADQLTGRRLAHMGFSLIDAAGMELPSDQHCSIIALRTARPCTATMLLKRPDASRAWLRVSSVPLLRPGESEPYAVTTTFADVTQEREDARLLEESMQQYRLLADNSADLVSRRTLDHRFEYASPSHAAILGWTSEDLIGRTPFELIHPDDLPRVLSGPVTNIAAGTSSSITFRVRHKDGHYIWIEGLTTPLRDADGVPTGYTVCARDITVRRQLEEQLRQSQKMDAMGRMASGVAHDFNNLLTVIRNAAELIQSSGGAPDQGVFAELDAAVSRAASLTSRLLAFSSGQHCVPQRLEIAGVVRESRPLLQRVMSERSRLELQVAPSAERAWVWGDKTELTQVLLNLVMNAIDAMPTGGPVLIAVERTTLERPLSHRLGSVARGDYVKLAVTDSGVGIADSQLEHIFDPFYTTKPQGKGTGLGLSTVWGIVQHAHGEVVVDSVPNRGSRFTVYWPVNMVAELATADEPPRASSTSEATPVREPSPLQPSTAKTLLLVDDEPAVLSLASQLLERCGYQVLRAGSGAEALQLMTQRRAAVDALVTDVRMPGMTGPELVLELRALGIELPVLFVSGQLDAQIPSDMQGGAPRRFLPKPFTSEQLEREVDRLFETREVVCELMN